MAYDWPGNGRELRNVIERAVVLQPNRRLEPIDLFLDLDVAPARFHDEKNRVVREFEERYVRAAVDAARFVLGNLVVDDRLLRTWKDGRAHLLGLADDHAFLLDAMIDLYEATFDLRWLDVALALADRTVALFWDEQDGGLF